MTPLALFASVVLSGGAVPDAAPLGAWQLGPAARSDSVGTTLRGEIRVPGYRNDGALPGALVEVRQGNRTRTAVADAWGRYFLDGLEGGRARLTVFHVATYNSEVELVLPARGVLVVDLEMERRTIALAPVTVAAAGSLHPSGDEGSVPFPEAQPRLAQLRLRAIESSTGMVESGLTGGLGREPPGEDTREPERVLFMRGSTVDARQVLLDGAPILTPFHLAGLVPSFDARILHDARIFMGGAPARYDGGLSYVLDVETRAPRRDRLRVDAALDGLALRTGVEAPLPWDGGILSSGRHLHGAQSGLLTDGGLPYRYDDLLVRAGIRPHAAHELRVTGFRNREGVALDFDPSRTASAAGGRDEAAWGNSILSVGWTARLDGLTVDAVGALARYDAVMPVLWAEPVVARSVSDRGRAALTFRQPWGEEGEVTWGASAERQDLLYRLEPYLRDGVTRVETHDEALRGDRVGVFAEGSHPVSRAVRVRGGARADRFASDGRVRVAPRAELLVFVSDQALLTLSAGRYHQYVPVPGLQALTESEEQDDFLFWNPSLAVASATHLVLGLDQDLHPGLHLGVSGFIKRFEGGGPGQAQRIHASGTDLRLTREGERVDAWVGYALSWFWEPAVSGSSDRFTGRHLLTTGVRTRFFDGLEVGGSLEYGAGLPLTEVPLGTADAMTAAPASGEAFRTGTTLSSRNEMIVLAESNSANPLNLAPEDDFLRLDLEAAWVMQPRFFGRDTEVRPYVRLLNALDRRDALFWYFDRWRGEEIRPLTRRPVLPLVGMELRF